MASSSTAAVSPPVGPDTLITIKINVQGHSRKLKLPLKDLTHNVLPTKLREFLGVADNQIVLFERFSDSSASYVSLEPANLHAYKTLYRAAKAKLKLRLRAHVHPSTPPLVVPSQLPSASATTLVSAQEPLTNQSQLEPVSAAITNFCATVASQQTPASASSNITNVPVQSAIEAKTAEFHQKVREMDEQLKLKIGAHRLRQSSNMSNEKISCRLAPEPAAAAANDQFKLLPTFQPQNGGCPGLRMSHPPKLPDGATYSWSVYCNHCNKNMLDEHYHCNSCENGDYDLCVDCMSKGKHCLSENHWLIKRYLRNGKVINGTTQKHCFASSPKIKAETSMTSMPGAFTEEKKVELIKKPTRTCNCCVKVFDEDEFVTCEDCDDYDLCVPCLEDSKHGHHPAHTFTAATNSTKLSPHAHALCKPGRNVSHAAVCDECDNRIVGVRHKCLVCPDWDYCSTCIKKSASIHRGHRFAPIYESIASPLAISYSPTHVGVYCDGPQCKDKSVYISGVRWKCAICPDLDFCASCEAQPHLKHNRTHPMLKFQTPVRGCNITAMVDEKHVHHAHQEQAFKTQVQTVAEVEPTACMSKFVKEKVEIKNLVDESQTQKVLVTRPKFVVDDKCLVEPVQHAGKVPEAVFVRDTITDGTSFETGAQFVQVWTMRNPGPDAWPAGSSVRYVGGDNMLNVDNDHPSSDSSMETATESNRVRRAVQAGEEFSFRVVMKAPAREGVAISYWRLKTNDGIPFGHRLWCHINVSPKIVDIEKTDSREVGRGGVHDTFLRYSLGEQSCQKMCPPTIPCSGRYKELEELRKVLKQYTAENGNTLRNDKIDESLSREASKITSSESGSSESSDKRTEAVPESKSSQTLSFPTLDMSSSASIAGKEALVTNAATTENIAAVAAAPLKAETEAFEDVEIFDDAESIDLLDDSSSDGGFLTEDEYDIVDSDSEIA